jgi:hypothetical protein
MATVYDICVVAGFNIVTAVAFLLVFAFLRSQPINDRALLPEARKLGTGGSQDAQGRVDRACRP